jgi:hypothetical protein
MNFGHTTTDNSPGTDLAVTRAEGKKNAKHAKERKKTQSAGSARVRMSGPRLRFAPASLHA